MAASNVPRVTETFAFLFLMLFSASNASAEANTWSSGFYKSSEPSNPVVILEETSLAPSSVCFQQIMAAQKKYGIPDNLLLAIGLQESGRRVSGKLVIWPWTANTNGKGAFFGSKAALDAYVRKTQGEGVFSTDVGCMQINQRWHADQFTSLEAATDPHANVDYAARFLKGLFAQTRDWWEAAGRYHSKNEVYKTAYLKKLVQNQRVAQRNASQFSDYAQTTDEVTLAVVAPSAQPGFNWSADMTDANSGRSVGAMSIYSAQILQPILPSYAKVN